VTVDSAALHDLAVEAAGRAAAFVVESRPENLGVLATKSSATDVVTEMDTGAQELLVEVIGAARPGDGFLGEEGIDRAGDSDVVWVLDPIDGTVNYLYGIPAFAVCVAARVGDRIEVGVVADPSTGEVYRARRGHGAWLGPRRLAVTQAGDLSQALVATGFGYEAARRSRQAEVLREVLPAVRDIRRFGSAGLDLCALARGRVDAYYERGLKPWDLAAAGLVAEEAGAQVAGLRGAAAGEELVVATNPALFPALHDLLLGARADRD
jgi:myo-inositol-1(or 4)-monophosphatase